MQLQHLTSLCLFFFFNDTATTEIYTLSLHDALPISRTRRPRQTAGAAPAFGRRAAARRRRARGLHLQPDPLNRGGAEMQVSYFETGRYYAPSNLLRQWPMPAGVYDREAGLRAFRGMVERSRYVEELGYDWVSVSEHHYSPRILTPSLPI